MNWFQHNATLKLFIAAVSLLLIMAIIFFIYKAIFYFLKKKALNSKMTADDYFLDLIKTPGLLFIYWFLLKAFSYIFLSEFEFFKALNHLIILILIYIVSWISVQFIKAGAYYLQSKLNVEAANNLIARKNYTLIKIFKGIAITIIVIIAIAISLLTFEQAKTIGVSLLTSAGLIGIIVGFAAQKSLGMILAGIQLAITQPIRHDDVVIVEGEWGRIEEITLTYVVVKIWDERRLVLPVTYFLEQPFQNWTRTNSDITGTVFIYADYSLPVDELRNIIPQMLKDNKNWDGRVFNIQVTNTTERHKEIRILLSSSSASMNWDLRTYVREKIIDYINEKHPGALAKIRVQNV